MTQLLESSLKSILMICGTWPPLHCGVGDYAFRLCTQLAGQAIHVHVLTSHGVRSDFRVGGGAMMNVMPSVQKWNQSIFGKAVQAVQELKPGLVLIQWPTAVYGRSLAVNQLAGRLKKRFPNLPIVTTLHEYRYFHWIGRWRAHHMIRSSDRTVLVDPQDMQMLATRSKQGLQHIPIGSNIPRRPESFDRLARRRALGFNEKDFVFVFFGFINPPKGVEVLLEALDRLAKREKRVRLLLLAQLEDENPYHRQIASMIRRLKLTDRIVNPAWGTPGETAENLAAADCAVLPYRDGVSLKRGTLMACLEQSLPVIATSPLNHTGPLPIELDTQALVPAGNVELLEKIMEKCVQEPMLLEGLARRSDALRIRFGWDLIAQQYLDLFADVMEEYC